MLELSDLADLAFRDQGRFQDVTEEEQQNTGTHACLFKGTVSRDFLEEALCIIF